MSATQSQSRTYPSARSRIRQRQDFSLLTVFCTDFRIASTVAAANDSALARGVFKHDKVDEPTPRRTRVKYRRFDAKDYARTHMRGIWAAALMPFAPDLSLDEAGFRRNLRHWVDDLGIDGVFVAGKQSEFFSMSVSE